MYLTCPFCRTRLQETYGEVSVPEHDLDIESGEVAELDLELTIEEHGRYGICKRLLCVCFTISILSLFYFL